MKNFNTISIKLVIVYLFQPFYIITQLVAISNNFT